MGCSFTTNSIACGLSYIFFIGCSWCATLLVFGGGFLLRRFACLRVWRARNVQIYKQKARKLWSRYKFLQKVFSERHFCLKNMPAGKGIRGIRAAKSARVPPHILCKRCPSRQLRFILPNFRFPPRKSCRRRFLHASRRSPVAFRARERGRRFPRFRALRLRGRRYPRR